MCSEGERGCDSQKQMYGEDMWSGLAIVLESRVGSRRQRN